MSANGTIDGETAADALNRVAEAGGFDDLLEIKDKAERHVWLTARVADFIDNPEAVSWAVDDGRRESPVTGVITFNIVDDEGKMIVEHTTKSGTMVHFEKKRIVFRPARARRVGGRRG